MIGSFSLALASRAEPGSAEQRVHLIPAGTFAGRDGRGPYRLDNAEAVIAESRRHAGKRLIPIDYDHQIDLAATNGKPAPAAGWIKGLLAADDGIWGLVEWTDRAAKHIAGREYRYLSPAIRHSADGTVRCLLRAALTNNPNLDQLTALAAKEDNMDDITAQLRTILGLPEDADVAAIIAKIRELLEARQSAAPDPSKFVPIGDFERAVAEVQRLTQGISLQAATDHVSRQIRDADMPTFLRDWGIALCTVNKPAFDAFITRTKGLFNRLAAPSGASGDPPGKEPASRLTEEETALCMRMGISADEFLKSRTFIETTNGV